jgi:iron complex outermembrane receptor protein
VNYSQLACAIWVGTVAAAIVTPPVSAEETRLRDFSRSATTVKEWLAQVEETKNEVPVPVIGVQLNRLETELEIVLETQAGRSLQIDATQFRTEGTSLIATIPNAVLSLPNTQEFTSNNPTPGIANVRVTQVDASTIRVSVTGTNAVPSEEITLRTGDLSYSLNPERETPEEELVVTGERPGSPYFTPNASSATRTDTPIRDTPASVQIVPKEVIEDQQSTRIEEVLRNVSGITFQGSNFGRSSDFAIRGFGASYTAPPLLRDGFRLYSFVQGFPELANLERVEVLKGPASILYGDIQPGGLVNLVSKQPLSQPFYEAELQVGSRNLVRPRFDISGPLTTNGSLLYRLNGLYQHADSFRDYTTSQNRFFVGPALSWKIDPDTDLNLSLEYTYDKRPADRGISAFGNGVAPVPRDRVFNEPDDTITNRFTSVGYTLEHRFNENWKIRNAFRYLNTDYSFNLIALPFTLIEPQGTLLRFFADQDGTENSYSVQTNVQGKFNTGSVRHVFLFGVDFNHSDQTNVTIGDFVNPLPLDIFNPVYGRTPRPATSTLPVVADQTDHVNRVGVYLQDQIYLLDNLIVLGGLRYDTVHRKTVSPDVLFSPGGVDVTQDEDALIPRFGIVYQPIPELSLYASYSQSFSPNTASTVGGNLLEPERGEGYEVGIKAELLNRKLFATLTYFDITKRNVAVTDPNNPFFSIATGKQRSNGVELDITGQILPGWNVIANYAYTNARVTEDTNPEFVGNRLAGIPFNSAGLWTTYEIQSGNLRGLGFGVGFNLVGERQGGLPNSFRVDSYITPNAAIFYHRDKLRLAVNFKNLSNANYIEAVGTSRESGVYPGEPFTVLGSVSYEF